MSHPFDPVPEPRRDLDPTGVHQFGGAGTRRVASGPQIGRRRVLQLSAVALGASALQLPTARSEAQAVLATGMRQVPAMASDQLVEAMGVRINTQLGSSAYGDRQSVRDAVSWLGLRYAREDTMLPSVNQTMASHQQQAWSMLAAVGCRIVTGVGQADGSEGSVAAFAAYHKSQFGGDTGSVLWGIEGANEWSGRRGPGNGRGTSPRTGVTYSSSYPLWAEQLAVWQRTMWQTYSGDPKLSGLAILGPALGLGLIQASVVNRVANRVYGGGSTKGLQPYLDFTNYHVYPGQAGASHGTFASVPSFHLDATIKAMKAMAPDRPFICTESGMHNALNSSNTNFSAHTTQAAGIYSPRVTLEHIWRGARRHMYFELVNQYPNPGLNEQDEQFGLFDYDWTPKPAALAWRRMTQLFADPGPSFTPTGHSLAVSGPSMQLRTKLFRKRNGTLLLAMWRDVSVYSYMSKQNLSVQAQTATVRLKQPSRIRLHRPSIADGVVKDFGTTTTAQVSMAGDVVVLEIT